MASNRTKKPRKTEWLGARIDEELYTEVDAYMAATGMTMADLTRKATSEYMLNHPVKPEPVQLKPGE